MCVCVCVCVCVCMGCISHLNSFLTNTYIAKLERGFALPEFKHIVLVHPTIHLNEVSGHECDVYARYVNMCIYACLQYTL